MITNPGFSFIGVSGQHSIIPTYETDLKVWGPIYTESVICNYDGELVTVYSNGPGFSYDDESVAMQFAAIDIADHNTILNFCDKYGMPAAARQNANFRNDYLFFNENKDNFSKAIPFGRHKETMWLGIIKKEIIDLRLTMELNQAIQDENMERLISIITFICLDLSGLDFEGSERRTETFQFNHAFFRIAEHLGYSKQFGPECADFSTYIKSFLESIDTDFYMTESYHANGEDYPSLYPQIYFSMWQHLVSLFTWLIQVTTIETISPYGEVVFNPPLHSLDLSDITAEKNQLINTAKGVLSDIFKEKLHRVYPELVFNKGNNPETSWRIPSLVDAMYLEVFFRLTPSTSIKKCANPTCPNYFQWSTVRRTRKYCCSECAVLMAKRAQRAREKEKRSQ